MITLHFSTTNALSSEAIRLFERGWCSHIDFVLPDGSLLGARDDAIGGQPPGVRIRPPNYEDWSQTETITLNCMAEQEAELLVFLRAQVGKPYDSTAIAAFALGRDWRASDSWFCSELGAAALEECGWFPRMLDDVANHITPRDLLLLVSPWRAVV